MAKYDPLYRYLRDCGEHRVTLTFAQVAEIVGGLPPSALKFQAWWENENEGSHVQAHAWMNAGYRVASITSARRSRSSAPRPEVCSRRLPATRCRGGAAGEATKPVARTSPSVAKEEAIINR